MTTPRLHQILGAPPPKFASSGERQGTINQAVRDAYMLDTSAGQFTMLAATANVFGVPIQGMYRPVVEGYSPFDEDLRGYEQYLDEFAQSTSPQETMLIKQMIQNNMDLRKNLEDYGGWRFATGLLDPINLIPVPMALGKGFAQGAKQALKYGTPIVGGTELIRHAIDPTSTIEETLFATVGGSLFMGLVGGIVGKIPKSSITVGEALNKLAPPPGTTSMFAGVPFHLGTEQGLFKRITNALRSAVSYGEPSWTKVDPESVRFDVDDSYGEFHQIVRVIHKDTGHVILEGIDNGKGLQINSVYAPEGMKRQGFGSYAIKQAVEYAEKRGLTIVSDTSMTKEAMFMWHALDKAGFNIKENPNWKPGGKDGRVSTDGEPLFVAERQIDPEQVQISPEIREQLDDLAKAKGQSDMVVRVFEEQVKVLKQKVKDAPVAGGAKTKAKKQLDDALSDLLDAKTENKRAATALQEANVAAARLLDEGTVKDWDLLPTGYNKILGKTEQFPWWTLMKTELRELAPDLAVKYQMFALKMAATPGLNNKGNLLGHTTGPSVEALTIEYTGRWLSATRNAQRIYRKYAGFGESSGQVKHFAIDQHQRVRSKINQWEGGEPIRESSEGKLTIAEFEKQISVAIAEDGKHAIPEVAEAASDYIRVLDEMGREGRDLGVFASQKAIQKRIDKLTRQIEEFDERWKKFKDGERPAALQAAKLDMELRRMELEDMAQAYVDAANTQYVHRMWLADEVVAQEDTLKALLRESFEDNPKFINLDESGNPKPEHPDIIEGRVNEAYASILHDAETGGDIRFAPESFNKRDWLLGRLAALNENAAGLPPKTVKTQIKIIEQKLARIEQGTDIGGSTGPMIARRLILNDKQLIELGLIEGNVNSWMNHYVMRTAPIIETARMFGDGKAQKHIDDLLQEVYERAQLEKDPAKQAKILREMERGRTAMQDLRDIVHGVYQIPNDPHAVTPRVLRMLRNFNILGAMGRSVFMAMGDLGNVVVSQGLVRSLRHAIRSFGAGLTDGNIKMMRDEVDLAGSVSEVILGMRYHQMTDFGAAVGMSTVHPKVSKLERGLANASQRFFLWNLLGPWTDMARRFSGGMLQSRLIEWSGLWKKGALSAENQKVMARLGINKEQAIQFFDEWEASGSLKHEEMFIANTTQWSSREAVRVFRAAMNTEINRMVPTPGAVDKPKGLLKSEWWKVIGQYRGFSIAATHRIMGAGLQTKSADKYLGIASMVGIAMMVDALKRPDYIQMPIEEQVLRAVELSAVTGIILDINDTIERASAGTIGLRPALGMDIRERNPNWANRMGTVGAVPNQWLTLMYGLTSEDADNDELARAIRYMIPYNNLLWWNEAFTRAQRSAADMMETEE